MTYELENGMTIGAVEKLWSQHYVRNQGIPAISKLAIELEWYSDKVDLKNKSAEITVGPYMRSALVRGSPYTSMTYLDATPRIYVERFAREQIIVDNGKGNKQLICGKGRRNFSSIPVEVEEIKVQFDTSDMTWLIFFSEPTFVVCSSAHSTAVSDGTFVPGVVVPHGIFIYE
jgi:hypothetical protein